MARGTHQRCRMRRAVHQEVTTMTTPTAGPTPGTEMNALMTGAEYLESLRDAREVYIYGERVKDVTTHPAFRNAARSIMRLYDTLHDPAQRELLTTVDDYGIRTHKFFAPSKSAQELLAARDAIAAWARLSYGFMGRTPEYNATFVAQNSSAHLEKGQAEDFALVFIADMDTKGAKLLCRDSYQAKAISPF